MDAKSVGVVLLTLNAEAHLERLLPPLLHSPLRPKILVLDSSSTDKTREIALEKGLEVLTISRKDFNHGTTRELGRKQVGTDIVVFMTQDAYLVDDQALGLLVAPLQKGQASLSYARQIPRPEAGLLESFARDFNYPSEGHIRSLKDLSVWGVYSFFSSNSCAAYLNSALDTIGGFPSVLLGEDTVACAKLLRRGDKVAYCAEAKVEHSHNFTLKEEFKRNFDTGLSRREIASLLTATGGDTARGKAYAKSLLTKVALERPWSLPYAFCHLTSKWLGYKIGYHATKAPLALKRSLSSQPYYFRAD